MRWPRDCLESVDDIFNQYLLLLLLLPDAILWYLKVPLLHALSTWTNFACWWPLLISIIFFLHFFVQYNSLRPWIASLWKICCVFEKYTKLNFFLLEVQLLSWSKTGHSTYLVTLMTKLLFLMTIIYKPSGYFAKMWIQNHAANHVGLMGKGRCGEVEPNSLLTPLVGHQLVTYGHLL